MPNKVWDEITYPFLNFNGATVEFKPLNHVSKRATDGCWNIFRLNDDQARIP